MLRYVCIAVALKMFSANDFTREIYRKIGNSLGKRRNIHSYLKDGKLLTETCEKLNAISEGDKLLEIGTGWIHWGSIYLRLHYNVSIDMFDIWDNRQFSAMKSTFSELKEYLEKDATDYNEMAKLLGQVLCAKSFDELYAMLNLQYIVEKDGNLSQFNDGSFDTVLSLNVFEHIPPNKVKETVANIHRILKPGGYSIHRIGIDDHLSHYDRHVSQKHYLRYSDRTWRIFFKNKVQYFNRLQMSEWLGIFNHNDFRLLEKICHSCDIEALKIDRRYHHYEKEDLACTNLLIVHQKPLRTSSSRADN